MHKLEDTYKMKGLRLRLVEELKSKGIKNKSILDAVGSIPRHLFLDKAFWEWAYKDQAFPIAANQTISQPYTVAFQTELLDVSFDDKVLEIGTGSGYQASVLSLLCKKVYSIERQEVLFKNSSQLLYALGYKNVRCYYGDGYAGLSSRAPFDKILVTCGAPHVPTKLLSQLSTGGQLVVPVGKGDTQEMLRITKKDDGKFTKESFGDCAFVPFLEGVDKNFDSSKKTSRVVLD